MYAPNPNLENLRKQAKRIVKQHREQYFPVCARIRISHSKFSQKSDKEILASLFALHDAQEVIAREHGFKSWDMLKNGMKTMEKPEVLYEENEISLCGAFPQLFVSDVTTTANYYRDLLGFKIGYLYGEPPFYGLVKRGGASLNIRHVCNTPMDQSEKESQGLLSANIPVDGVRTLFLELKEKGVEFAQSLKSQPWGADDFIVKDCDGNLVCFASRI